MWSTMMTENGGTVQALGWLSMGIGRAIAAVIAEPVYRSTDGDFRFGRIFGVGLLCAGSNILAIACVYFSVRIARNRYQIKL